MICGLFGSPYVAGVDWRVMAWAGFEAIASGPNAVVIMSISSNGICATTDGTTLDYGLIMAPIPKANSDTLTAINYANGMFIASGFKGAAGVIFESTDRVTWTRRLSNLNGSYDGIAYGAGLYVAVLSSGGVHTSPDLTTWTARTSGTANALKRVMYEPGLGLFVAVGSAGTIITSPDGITWTVRTSGTASNLTGIAYGAGTFVAGGSTNNQVVTSPTGVTWAVVTTGVSMGNAAAVIFAGGQFVSVGTTRIWTSPDGATWTAQTPTNDNNNMCIGYVNGTYIVSSDTGKTYYSTNGISWLSHIDMGTNFGGGLGMATDGAGQYIVVGAASSNNYSISMSPDRVRWLKQTFSGVSSSDVWNDVCYGGAQYVAVGRATKVVTSPNGTTWTQAGTGPTTIQRGVCYDSVAGRYVSCGNTGTIFTSPDGTTWTSRTSGVAVQLNRIEFGNGHYVAVGKSGALIWSTDSVNWNTVSLGIATELFDVRYVSSLFIAAGANGKIFTSVDGEMWTSRTSGTIQDIQCVNGGLGIFVALASTNTALKSSDGITWSVLTTQGGPTWARMVFDVTTFLACGSSKTFAVSP